MYYGIHDLIKNKYFEELKVLFPYLRQAQLFQYLTEEMSRDYDSLAEVIEAYQALLRDDLQKMVDEVKLGFSEEDYRKTFVLDSLFLTDSALECRYACDGQSKYHVLNMFCPGVATVGDSLMVLDKLVFQEKRYSYAEFRKILESNYEGQEAVRNEILRTGIFAGTKKELLFLWCQETLEKL